MKQEDCGSCIFYKDNGSASSWKDGYGVCRRYPEHVKTNDGRWCGEYKRGEKQ